MRVSSVSWHAMHSAGLDSLNLRRYPVYPRLDTTGVDVLVAQTPFPGRVAEGTRLVVRYHDAIPVFMPHTIADRSSHQAEHFNALMNCVRSGAWFACVSDATRRDLLRLFPEAAPRAVVIHDMVSRHYFQAAPTPEKVPEIIRARINEGSEQLSLSPKFRSLGDEEGFYRSALQDQPLRYLLVVSTLEPRKNHARLLAAWESLKSDVDPTLKLVVVGSLGWSAQEIVQGMRPWIDRGDLFALHAVPSPDLRVLYRHALATVCPSLGEGFDYSGWKRCAVVGLSSPRTSPCTARSMTTRRLTSIRIQPRALSTASRKYSTNLMRREPGATEVPGRHRVRSISAGADSAEMGAAAHAAQFSCRLNIRISGFKAATGYYHAVHNISFGVNSPGLLRAEESPERGERGSRSIVG